MKNHQGYSHVGYKIGHKFKALLGVALAQWGQASYGQTNGPQLVDPKLDVRAVVTNLNQPTTMAFLKHNDFLEGTEVCGFAILDYFKPRTRNHSTGGRRGTQRVKEPSERARSEDRRYGNVPRNSFFDCKLVQVGASWCNWDR